jgi:hypothetical protein
MQSNHPSKHAVREYMAKRHRERTPPPSPEQIRRELCWHLVEAERQVNRMTRK